MFHNAGNTQYKEPSKSNISKSFTQNRYSVSISSNKLHLHSTTKALWAPYTNDSKKENNYKEIGK